MQSLSAFQFIYLLISSFICLFIDHSRSWSTIQRSIQGHPDFGSHFVHVCPPGESWKQTEDFLDNKEENRIPFDFLTSPEAEDCFRSHLGELRAQQRKKQ
jgi:hypothetical protein